MSFEKTERDEGYTRYLTTKYLMFYEGRSDSGKTAVLLVYSSKTLELLATIKWFGRWRQYALFPAEGTVWNPECLGQVNDQITRLMEERKAA